MMSYLSATSDVNRLAKSKNLTMFYEELETGTLPQWIWITPNMSKSGDCPIEPSVFPLFWRLGVDSLQLPTDTTPPSQ